MTAGRAAKVLFLGLCLLATLFPLYWILVTSLKPPGAVLSAPLTYWPERISFDNYRALFADSDFGVYLTNSLLVALTAGAVATAISMLSGYVLARFTFRGRGAVLGAFLVTQMVPGFIALGPLYLLMSDLGLVDTRTGLILVHTAVCIPFGTVMLRGFLAAVPDALEEAAMIDGCSRLGALLRVIAPVMLPGIAATFVFNFVNCWNELFLSVTLMNSDARKTVPTALAGFISSYDIDWGTMSAAAVLTVLPTLLVFGLISRYVVTGLTSGAVKG